MSNALTFQSTTLDIIDHNGESWVRSSQLAQALGYSAEKSVSNLYARNSDEFTSNMSVVINLMTNGTPTETRIFSLRGCHLLAMFARTSIAKAFRVWVLDVLETLNRAEQKALPESHITPDQQCTLQAMVKGLVDKGGTYAQIYSRLNNHFRIAKYSQLPQSRMSEAVDYLMRYEVVPKVLPEPPQEEDASVYFRKVREDLQLVLKILDVHSVADFRLLQSGRMSQLHIMKQCNTHVRRAQSGINTALTEIKDANRFARMLADNSGTGGHVVPLVKIGR
jgi:prophage antirepressor-like protein